MSTRADVKCHPVLIIIWRRGFKPEIRTPLISVAIVKGRARKDAIGNSPIIATSGHALALPCRRSLVSGVLDEMMFCHVQFVASFFYVIRRVSVSLASSYCTSPCHFLLISVSKMPGGDRGRTYGTRSKTVARIADHTSRDLRIVFFSFESNLRIESAGAIRQQLFTLYTYSEYLIHRYFVFVTNESDVRTTEVRTEYLFISIQS